MRKCMIILSALLLVLASCGVDQLAELEGRSVLMQKGSSEDMTQVTFAFYLNDAGIAAVSEIIEKEITNAVDANNPEKAESLQAIKGKFGEAPESVIQNVSIAGQFNGWRPRADELKKGSYEGVAAYSLRGEWEFTADQEPYKFVFALNITDDPTKSEDVWVADPHASVKVDDGFGGFNSMLELSSVE